MPEAARPRHRQPTQMDREHLNEHNPHPKLRQGLPQDGDQIGQVSIAVPFLTAAMTPRGNARTTVITRETRANLMELGKRSLIKSSTGT